MGSYGQNFFSRSLTVALLVATNLVATAQETPAAKRQSGKILGTGKEKIVVALTAPKGGWTVDRMLLVEGTVSDASCNPVTVNINGDRYLLRTNEGRFKRKFPVASGKNSVIVQATNAAGTGQAERTVFAQIAPVAMVAVLTSDTDGVYTDLHIYEPDPTAKDPFADNRKSMAHVYWADTSSPTGGKFYLNEQGDDYDQPGYGPYLYTHTAPPIGIYRIDANYWPSGDKAHTLGTLNLTLFGGTPSEIRRAVQYPLVMPGETATLAWIRIDRGQKVAIWAPSIDAKPAQPELWPAWVLKFKNRRKESGEES